MTAENVVAMKLRSLRLRSTKDISLTQIKRFNRFDNEASENLYDVPFEVQKQPEIEALSEQS